MRRALSSALLLTFSAVHASATTVVDVPLPELVKDSPVIVEGVVTERTTQWTKDRRIETLTTLRVSHSYKTELPAYIVIKQHGGTMDGVTHAIPGDATFELGEEVLVFLEPSVVTKGTFILVGMSATKFRIEKNGSEPIVVRDVNGLGLVRLDPDGVFRTAPPRDDGAISLDAMRRTIADALP